MKTKSTYKVAFTLQRQGQPDATSHYSLEAGSPAAALATAQTAAAKQHRGKTLSNFRHVPPGITLPK